MKDNKPWQPDYPPILNYQYTDDLSGEYPVDFDLSSLLQKNRRKNLMAHNETVKIIMEIMK